MERPVSGQEVHIDWIADDGEAMLPRSDAAEFLHDFATRQEDVSNHFFIAEAWGDQNAVDSRGGQLSEERFQVVNVGFTINGGVRAHPKTLRLGGPYSVQGLLKPAPPADDSVVDRFRSVEVDIPGEVRTGPEVRQGLLKQQAVGAKIDVFPARKNLFHQLLNMGVKERLASRHRHNGSAGLIHGAEAFLQSHLRVQAALVFPNPSASRTSEIAPVGRFEHENQREALIPLNSFPE
jgi:hypothetical protein